MKIYNEHHIGETHMSREGYEMKVIKGNTKPRYVLVRIDGRYNETVKYSNLVKGKVKNLYHKSVYCTGYIGIGRHKVSIKGVKTKKYKTWKRMIKMCYDYDYRVKHPTCKDVTVCKEWHNFQVFGEWYDNQHKEDGWKLYRNLLSGNKKIYSPDTCAFMPRELNLFLSRETKYIDRPAGVSSGGSKYESQDQCLSSGRRVYLGIFDTPEEADLAYINIKYQTITLLWLKYLDKNPDIDCKVHEWMNVVYKEHMKERNRLKKRIANKRRPTA